MSVKSTDKSVRFYTVRTKYTKAYVGKVKATNEAEALKKAADVFFTHTSSITVTSK